MEHSPQELLEQLKNNHAALEGLMRSPDGLRLMQMMTQNDGGQALQRAAKAASMGDTAEISEMVQSVLQSQEGTALAERIRKSMRL